jgi:thymidylate synthase (FAD)
MPSVSLIWITPGAEQQIAYCARVSNPSNQNNPDYAKLLRYCAEHGHWSVFEMANMCVEINTTRDISAQILRHRSLSFQEFSTRYSDTSQLGKVSLPDLRMQDKKNRQNSIRLEDAELTEDQVFRIQDLQTEIDSLYRSSTSLYGRMLSEGIAKECARKILPLNTPTRLYANGTLRSWIHYVQVRGHESTQLEHRQIALEVKDIMRNNIPTVYEALLAGE